MSIEDADRLAFDMPFAKVVNTPQGDAILIGFQVFHVTGPDGNAALLMAQAMRHMSRDCVRLSEGDASGDKAAIGNA